jgi:hypothetical protein
MEINNNDMMDSRKFNMEIRKWTTQIWLQLTMLYFDMTILYKNLTFPKANLRKCYIHILQIEYYFKYLTDNDILEEALHIPLFQLIAHICTDCPIILNPYRDLNVYSKSIMADFLLVQEAKQILDYQDTCSDEYNIRIKFEWIAQCLLVLQSNGYLYIKRLEIQTIHDSKSNRYKYMNYRPTHNILSLKEKNMIKAQVITTLYTIIEHLKHYGSNQFKCDLHGFICNIAENVKLADFPQQYLYDKKLVYYIFLNMYQIGNPTDIIGHDLLFNFVQGHRKTILKYTSPRNFIMKILTQYNVIFQNRMDKILAYFNTLI